MRLDQLYYCHLVSTRWTPSILPWPSPPRTGLAGTIARRAARAGGPPGPPSPYPSHPKWPILTRNGPQKSAYDHPLRPGDVRPPAPWRLGGPSWTLPLRRGAVRVVFAPTASAEVPPRCQRNVHASEPHKRQQWPPPLPPPPARRCGREFGRGPAPCSWRRHRPTDARADEGHVGTHKPARRGRRPKP